MRMKVGAAALLLAAAAPSWARPAEGVEEVVFTSADGWTVVKGYVFRPLGSRKTRRPAIVMLHGRTGAYSSKANGRYDASTLAGRHRAWADYWTKRGYLALMVDDFGPLGAPAGFKAGTNRDRDRRFDEISARPLHAYGALAYLRRRPDVDGSRIGLMGWSNGGSALLAAMADKRNAGGHGFRGGVALYPGCGLKGRFKESGYKPYAPVEVHIGTADEEVSFSSCEALVAGSRKLGGRISIALYPGAGHGFDTPPARQGAHNAAATAKAESAIANFFARLLR